MAAEEAKNFCINLLIVPCDHLAGGTLITGKPKAMNPVSVLLVIFQTIHSCA